MKTTRHGPLLIAALLCIAGIADAASKRVYVYPVTQQYWDVRPGEILADITRALLPGEPEHRQRLMQDIVRLNPGAFINGNPDRLLADTRLWLPGTATRPVSSRKRMEKFDWGYINRSGK